MNNIFKRYNFLKKYFGTKEAEDVSYNNAVLLFWIYAVGMIAVCFLEMIFYFVYSEQVFLSVVLNLIFIKYCLVSPLDKNHKRRENAGK